MEASGKRDGVVDGRGGSNGERPITRGMHLGLQ